MALIEKLEHQVLERRAVHKRVRCSFSIVTDEDGSRLLQLDTYGSKERQIKDKKSQSIRFSKAALSQLLALIEEYELAH
jgi:hypothetical protein